MNCYNFCHDNTFGGSAYVSGTTCDGDVGAYYLTLGQCICMDTDQPLITCDALIFSGYCFVPGCDITNSLIATPTMTPTMTQTPTETPTSTPTQTMTQTSTPTNTPTNTNTQTSTNTPTPSFTPTNTTTPTQTVTGTPPNTPTNTPTPTLTPTNTNTPTTTTTLTATITPTPSTTMAALCPEQLNYTTTFSGLTGADGTYQRLYSYTGGTFNFGYQSGNTFYTGSNWVVFGKNDGTNYYEIIAYYLSGTFQYYMVQKSTGDYSFNGGTFVASDNIGINVYETIDGQNVPKRGGYVSIDALQNISYPAICPTPTPTYTPTTTSTNTPTPSITPSTSFVSGTTEAETYLAAVLSGGGSGLTSTISGATITMFRDIMANNLWDKLDIFYPMIGENSGGMKVNGRNPGTYDLTFNGGWTFGVSGATANGTNSYANTAYADSNTSLNNLHMGIYSFKEVSNTGNDCGITSVTANSRTTMYLRDNTQAGFAAHRANSGYITWTNAANTGGGIYIVNRTASNEELGYVNGVYKTSGTTASTAVSSLPYIFGARIADSSSVGAYSNRGYNWFSVGKGLTSGETATLSSIINTFNDTLNRNTY